MALFANDAISEGFLLKYQARSNNQLSKGQHLNMIRGNKREADSETEGQGERPLTQRVWHVIVLCQPSI